MVKALLFHCKGAWVPSLVRKEDPAGQSGLAKKKKVDETLYLKKKSYFYLILLPCVRV